MNHLRGYCGLYRRLVHLRRIGPTGARKRKEGDGQGQKDDSSILQNGTSHSAHSYPFKAPILIPLMNMRWNSRNTPNMGSEATAAPAMRRP